MGSAFIRFLFEQTDFSGRVINVDLLTYASSKRSLASCESSPRYTFYQANIHHQAFIEELLLNHEIDAVIHFAAETHVDRSIQHPEVFVDTNIRGTFTLLECIRKYPHIHFHQISTDEVFGSLGEGGTFHEHTPYRPSSPYAASKAASDHLVSSYAKTYGLSITISHSVNNYGPFQHREKLIPCMLHKAFQNKKLPLYGSGQQERSWIYVDDHAFALWTILTKGEKGQAYGICGTDIFTNLAVVKKILSTVLDVPENQLDESAYISHIADRPGHDFRYALDGKKLHSLGYKPKIDFAEGLKKTISWYKKERYANTAFSGR